MIYLSKKDIQAVFTMQDAIAADKEALAQYSKGLTNIPLRANIDVKKYNGQNLYMPGFVDGDAPAAGVKIVSVYPDNAKQGLPSVPATMITLDAATGQVNAVLDGTYLTQLRTGAVQGAATDLLARKDSKVALLIGTGGQALSQLAAMLTVRKLTKVYVADLALERAQQFVGRAAGLADQFAVQLIAIADPNQVVGEADIITSVTTSHQPTFDGTLVKPGTHINGVGAYTPAMCELPLAALTKANQIFVDTFDGVLAEAGDFIKPMKAGQLTKADLTGELGQLVNGQVSGRTAASDISVFKTVGTAALDVLVADKIVKRAAERGVGQRLGE